VNGEGDLGFPYFLLCYRGIAEMSNFNADQGGEGDNPDCSGHGETWGPGIGPPPEGCGGGPPPDGGQGQSSESGLIAIPWYNPPPNSGAVLLTLLALAVVAANRIEIPQKKKEESTITGLAS
ncbi:MAG: hypothetical protein VX666_00365, partial [Candidatus Thermoplasmatota archaeon]|nr:hypothetical protein [Candidatus Thermoplasmatota archaeon]